MKQLILSNISQFVEMDPSQTNKLAELWFDRDHIAIVDALKDMNELIFRYISALLQEREQQIINEYN